jgi:hypothetical protein
MKQALAFHRGLRAASFAKPHSASRRPRWNAVPNTIHPPHRCRAAFLRRREEIEKQRPFGQEDGGPSGLTLSHLVVAQFLAEGWPSF